MDELISKNADWSAEYNRKGIPSSFRSDPSGSLLRLFEVIGDCFTGEAKAIDIGCGTGRNSIALAERGFKVTAFDFSEVPIETLEKQIKEADLAGHIFPYCHDVTLPWPTNDRGYDLAIDTFCFKHQIPSEHRIFYRNELMRSLKDGGLFLLTLADTTDGYYRKFFVKDRGENVIVDPQNNIPSVLYQKEEVIEFFKNFDLVHHELKQKPSKMHGKIYDRATHLFIFKK